MDFVNILVIFPMIAGLFMFFIKQQRTAAIMIRTCATAITALSIIFTFYYWNGAEFTAPLSVWLSYLIVLIEAGIAAFIIVSGIKSKKYLVSALAFVQIAILIVYEFTVAHNIAAAPTFVIDRLALMMVLIVGVIGSLICVLSIKYMQDYHRHNNKTPDRRGMFFGTLFIFTGAMFGLVLANKMSLMLLFWEVTSLASFLLIGYSKTKEAIENSFLALTINVFGGLLLTIAIVIAGTMINIGDFKSFVSLGGKGTITLTAAFLFACAGLTKSAQMPFSKWLLGAMVAPTPVSAILHSSTMVKAGVYLIIRMAPMLGLNAAGVTITLIGALTFLIAAIIAISQSDIKKVLAYSTISNLGLIVACAGINTAESLWAAMMLIVFHAVTKSLLFLTAGTTEHCIGSRDIERMDGLYKMAPVLAMLLIIGIAGMFIAPFGMIISKWAAMKAFLDYNHSLFKTLILLIIAFGSAVTFFYWTKLLGKLIADTKLYAPEQIKFKMNIDEKVSLYSHGIMVVLLCMTFPLVSQWFVLPYISGIYSMAASPIGVTDTALVLFIMLVFFLMAAISIPLYRKYKKPDNTAYMAGQNTGDNQTYHGSIGRTVTASLGNWYMKDVFGEKIWFRKSQAAATLLLLIGFVSVITGVAI